MGKECQNCASTKELVSNVIIKSDHYYDAREVTTICGNCFWGKSRIRTYADKSLQKQAEKPFAELAKRYAELSRVYMDKLIIESVVGGT